MTVNTKMVKYNGKEYTVELSGTPPDLKIKINGVECTEVQYLRSLGVAAVLPESDGGLIMVSDMRSVHITEIEPSENLISTARLILMSGIPRYMRILAYIPFFAAFIFSAIVSGNVDDGKIHCLVYHALFLLCHKAAIKLLIQPDFSARKKKICYVVTMSVGIIACVVYATVNYLI